MAEKKYYWLKMTDQFFEDKAIKKLRKIAGGDTYTIIYLKMLLTAIKQGNKMYFEGIEDDFMEELALELDEDTDNVKVTVSYLKSKGLIEVLGADEILLTQCAEMVGSETDAARRKRLQRDRERNRAIGSDPVPALEEKSEVVVEEKPAKKKAENTIQLFHKKFRQAGMTAAGACGLIGNLEAESDGFYTNRVEYLCLKRLKEKGKVYTHATYTAAIDSGKISCEEFLHPLSGKQYGYGLAQWTSPGRKSGLWNFAKQRGVSIADEDMQLDFLLKELRESYSPVLAILKSATTIRQASDVVLKKFEIPANTGESVCESRAARGQKFYNDYAKEEKIVSVKISNCGHDENGRYAGGQAGDQTGTEYQIINWYNRPWLCVLRFEDQEVAALIAEMATQAANNNMIGYDQGTAGNSNDRYTFWEQLAANGYDPSKIKKPCETDCSQSTASIVKAVGYRLNKPKLKAVSVYLTTYNMRSAFKTAGAKVLTDQKYLTSGTCLKPGDILLNDNHHVAIAVSGDASSNATPAKKNYLEKGDTGSEVTAMQKMLIKVGYSCGAAGADGDFGSDTDSALRKFQKDNGLTVDGQYGTNSKAKLTALYNKKVGTTTSNKKDVTTVAKEVIAGKWGSGDERKKKLTAAGYNYDTVQKKVNELLKTRTKKSVAEVAKEVVSGKWGNGADRKKKLEAAGYNYAEVQKEVNKLLK